MWISCSTGSAASNAAIWSGGCLVVAGEQAEHRDLVVGRAVERPALAPARERAVEADRAGQAGVAAVAGMNDCAPPKQKPTVTARSAPGACRTSAVATSSATVSGVVCATCGMYSKSSSRGPSPAVRPK